MGAGAKMHEVLRLRSKTSQKHGESELAWGRKRWILVWRRGGVGWLLLMSIREMVPKDAEARRFPENHPWFLKESSKGPWECQENHQALLQEFIQEKPFVHLWAMYNCKWTSLSMKLVSVCRGNWFCVFLWLCIVLRFYTTIISKLWRRGHPEHSLSFGFENKAVTTKKFIEYSNIPHVKWPTNLLANRILRSRDLEISSVRCRPGTGPEMGQPNQATRGTKPFKRWVRTL